MKILSSEIDELLSAWAAAHRRFNPKTGFPKSSPGFAPTPHRFSPEDPVIDDMLELMNKFKRSDPDLYQVALLEYESYYRWMADCRQKRGWLDGQGVWHEVSEPRRADYLRFIASEQNISKSDYYDKLNRLKNKVLLSASNQEVML